MSLNNTEINNNVFKTPQKTPETFPYAFPRNNKFIFKQFPDPKVLSAFANIPKTNERRKVEKINKIFINNGR
jgi:hypothetical protein